jgi:hypothetical protein
LKIARIPKTTFTTAISRIGKVGSRVLLVAYAKRRNKACILAGLLVGVHAPEIHGKPACSKAFIQMAFPDVLVADGDDHQRELVFNRFAYSTYGRSPG